MKDLSTGSASECLRIVEEDVPAQLQRALLRSVFENYRSAYEACYTEYESEQARDLNGHVRRANIERDLLGIGKRFRDADVKAEFYKNGTGAYAKLTCGRVVVTESAVQSPDSIVRSADFRKSLAGNAQMSLQFVPGEEEPALGDYLYVILLHGKDVKDRSRPAFAQLVVPSADCSSYLTRVDLFKRFPNVVTNYIPSAEPAVPEIKLVARKKQQKNQA